MRRLALVLALVTSTQALASPSQRSFISGVGVGLIGLGVGALGLGAGQLIASNDTRLTVMAYSQQAPTEAEAPGFRLILDGSQRAFTIGLVSGITGLVLVAGGVVALLLDRPEPAVSFFVSPTGAGGVLGLSGRF
ncbi:MAG: hypothetical protein MUC96_00290 [Myxococcaceae bacterium]|jgi:hypothetical protein|nr:hypothetical protein [Myxococcaceae bacterium]